MNYRTICLSTLFLTILIVSETNGKSFTRCELARELKRLKFDRSFLSNWVCLVENESNRDSNKIGNSNSLYPNYGLFQISSKDYCSKVTKGGLCNVKCDNLLGDKIEEASRCAKIIYHQHGFKAWKGWETNCKQKQMPDISNCFSR